MTDSQDTTTKKTSKKLIVAGAAIAVLVVAGGLVMLSGTGGVLNSKVNTGNNQQSSALTAAHNEVTIPVSSITNALSYYTYTSNGTAIKFFAVKGTDNNIHVAFNTCDVCGPKGYTQSGNDVVCSNCGKHFAITSIGTANLEGGCWPSHLPMSINGDTVTTKTSDLVTKESTFA